MALSFKRPEMVDLSQRQVPAEHINLYCLHFFLASAGSASRLKLVSRQDRNLKKLFSKRYAILLALAYSTVTLAAKFCHLRTMLFLGSYVVRRGPFGKMLFSFSSKLYLMYFKGNRYILFISIWNPNLI